MFHNYFSELANTAGFQDTFFKLLQYHEFSIYGVHMWAAGGDEVGGEEPKVGSSIHCNWNRKAAILHS